MVVVIPMSGKSQRADMLFKTNLPKFKIELQGTTFLERVLNGLIDLYDNKFFFIENFNKKYNDFINQTANNVGLRDWEIISINEDTKGQAETVYHATKFLNNNEELFIFNIDTELKNLSIPTELSDYCGWILTTIVEGDRWSFVTKNTENNLTDIKEKIRISDLGSVGLYYFRTINLFNTYFEKYSYKVFERYGEKYIAPLYYYIIGNSHKVLITSIKRTNVYFLDDEKDIIRINNDSLSK